MPADCAACPHCFAPNGVHPRIRLFLKVKPLLWERFFVCENDKDRVWGYSRTPWGKLALGFAGLAVLVFLALCGYLMLHGENPRYLIALPLLLWVCILLSFVFLLGLAGERIFPPKKMEFMMDFGSAPPKWSSSDDEYWRQVKAFLKEEESDS